MSGVVGWRGKKESRRNINRREKGGEMLRRKETETFVTDIGTNVVHADSHDNQPLEW